ncbi:28 kDa heat- and acid-stable phosphoprotein-like protein [Dinothrombium tinctorium]|uniref:28 kDa heat-and acid-stable phosphoprotein-like protein n=1 Tax=Dinothrombium tinctorium TaxID=1965070 RepID=A0A3S4QSS7_9ACAR|nr:28 kDa heat- and acid-stable phosphoprotein-like protein [Dinothrombium tinctorium]
MGKGRNHKGGRKMFTNFEEMEANREKEEKAKAWRERRGEVEESSEEEEEKQSSTESSAESSENSEDESDTKPKAGVHTLIEVNNPNRVVKKANKRVDLNVDSTKVELSRREREELNKQRAKEHYAKLTAEGKTEQARADLARLAIIRQQREEAMRKKEEEKRLREEKKAVAAAGKFAAVKSVSAAVTEGSSGSKVKTKRK